MKGSRMFDVSGQRVLVTGGSSGIGLAIAKAFGQAGARVHIGGLESRDCDAALALLAQERISATATGSDLRTRDGCETLCTAALEALGGIDALICSAGIEGPVGPIGQSDTDALRALMGINLEAPLWIAGRLAPVMAQQGGGTMSFLSSIAGLRGNRAIGAYGMSKAAIAQLARNIAVEWGPSNLRANAISPGLIRTPFAAGLMADAAFMARRIEATPLRRVGEPEDVAGVALFLASPAGAFITGQNIVVDGGTLIRD